jgi:hypothetical protein
LVKGELRGAGEMRRVAVSDPSLLMEVLFPEFLDFYWELFRNLLIIGDISLFQGRTPLSLRSASGLVAPQQVKVKVEGRPRS